MSNPGTISLQMLDVRADAFTHAQISALPDVGDADIGLAYEPRINTMCDIVNIHLRRLQRVGVVAIVAFLIVPNMLLGAELRPTITQVENHRPGTCLPRLSKFDLKRQGICPKCSKTFHVCSPITYRALHFPSNI